MQAKSSLYFLSCEDAGKSGDSVEHSDSWRQLKTKAVDGLRAMFEKGVGYAKGHAWLCETVSHSSGTESRPPGPDKVFWEMSRMHRHTAPGSRLQAPGPRQM